MNKNKALESVNEIKELMEKSSKFISKWSRCNHGGHLRISWRIYRHTSYYTGHSFNCCP